MKIVVDTRDLKERLYQVLRNLDDGLYSGRSVGVGCLPVDKSAALDDFIRTLEQDAQK